MRGFTAALLAALLVPLTLQAADPLAEARRLYNLGHYTEAIAFAVEAAAAPQTHDSAQLVLGRIHLELYRRTADQADFARARVALKSVAVEALDPRERVELTIGLGQGLFYEDRFGIAAETFERALGSSAIVGPVAHERLLDWWATALDRLAQSRPREVRETIYARVVQRMEHELALDPSSPPAAYWLAAALRNCGQLDRAWHTAAAGWITAVLARDRGAALRADLDRLVVQGIIPDRANVLQPRDPKPAGAIMLAEWEALKATWTR